MRSFLNLGLCCAIVLGYARIASASAVLTTADGNGADSFVSNDSLAAATTTHGTEDTAQIRNFADTRAKAMYLRFDLSSVSGDLSGATLTLDFTAANRVRAMNVYGLTDETGDNWSENSLAYNNAPGILQPASGGAAYNSGNLSMDTSKLTQVGSFTTPTAANSSVTTTTATLDLDSFLASDTNKLITLILYPAASDTNASYFVATKENAGGVSVFPTLTLPNASSSSTPEPAGLSLLGLGAVALVRRRRSK